MDWKDRIARCFGDRDGQFAVHPLDEGRAFELLHALRDQRVSWDEVQAAFREYLRGKGRRSQHINQQMKQVRAHFRPWLPG